MIKTALERLTRTQRDDPHRPPFLPLENIEDDLASRFRLFNLEMIVRCDASLTRDEGRWGEMRMGLRDVG